MQMTTAKILTFICGILLFAALLPLPIIYYTVLRWVVTIGGAAIITKQFDKGTRYWIVLFSVLLILFNPIFPVWLYQKSKWIPIDILGGLIFFGYGLFAQDKKSN